MNKILLILTFMICTVVAKSQMLRIIPKQKTTAKSKSLKKNYLKGFTKGESSLNSSVYIAPLDGMPCLVPNVRDIAKIPNAVPDSISIYIPNSYKKEN